MKFTELVRLLESKGFKVLKEKGSIRYYAKPALDRLVRLGPLGTCRAILRAAGINTRKEG